MRYFQKLLIGIVFALLINGCTPGSSPSPSPTPQNTPTPASTVAPQYSLQRPDVQQLIDLVAELRIWKRQNQSPETWQDEIISHGIDAMDKLIADDLKRHYPAGFQGASQYIEKIPNEWDSIPFPSASDLEIVFHQGMPEYFNKNQVRFIDKGKRQFPSFSVKSYLMASKGADNTESIWLLEIELAKQHLRYWLTLRQDQSEKYQVIPNDIFPIPLNVANYYSELTTDVDINNDGKNDILILLSHYSIGTVKKTLYIYTTNVQGVYLLNDVWLPHPPAYFDGYASEYKIGDYNKDGLLDIQVTTPKFEPFDCTWESISIIQFKDKERTEQNSNTKIPNTPSCAPAKALKDPNPREVQPLLKSARANLHKDASSDFRAWIQLWLAMSYYAQAKDTQALQELNQIAQISPVGSFQKAIQDAYAESGTSPLRMCEKLYNIAYKKENTGYNFSSDIDVDLAHFGAYPITIIPIPDYVCPYFDIVNFRLQTVTDNNTTPDTTFAHLGLILSSTYSVNIDTDPELEWVGLLGKEWPRLVFIDRTDDGYWHISEQTSYQSSVANLQVKTFDLTDDGQDEVIINFSASVIYWERCTDDKQHFELRVLDPQNTEDSELLRKEMDCTEQSPLNYLSAQEIKALLTDDPDENSSPFYTVQPPVWAKFKFNHGDSKSILTDVGDIQKAILENKQFEQVRTNIDAILHTLPENDAAADTLRERLIYITGLSYELQGDQENALKYYLGLIKTYPESLWSKLARTRISPEPIK